jgi:poly-gamma-glutamate capsule biosynthesis protein CapA/YwtB (metallophosphatase superfamily)
VKRDVPGNQLMIAAAGDFMISRRPTTDEISSTRQLFEGADVVIANIDTVLSNEGTPTPKWANLRGPREAAEDLRAMGIDVAIVANNHAMDFRAPGMLNSNEAMRDAGIVPVGAGANLAEATKPAVIDKDGVRVAILAMACTLPVESAALEDWPGIAPVRVRYAFEVDESIFAEQPGSVPEVRSWIEPTDLARARNDIAAASADADVVIAVVHWGVPSPWRAPFHQIIQDYQRELGHALVDAGAAAVIGNHPHELHGVEFFNGAPIAYCIGNFWIDTLAQYAWMGRESIILKLGVSKEGLSSVSVSPIMLTRQGLPELDRGGETIRLLDRLSQPFNVSVDSDSSLIASESQAKSSSHR